MMNVVAGWLLLLVIIIINTFDLVRIARQCKKL